MIKILDAKLRTRYPHSRAFKENTEELLLLLDRYPHFVYKKLDNVYRAEDSGFLSYFVDNNGRKDGFGGRIITLDMEDGTQKKFYGSLFGTFSSSDKLNVVSCSITDDKKAFEYGYTFIAGLINKDLYKKIRKEFKIS